MCNVAGYKRQTVHLGGRRQETVDQRQGIGNSQQRPGFRNWLALSWARACRLLTFLARSCQRLLALGGRENIKHRTRLSQQCATVGIGQEPCVG